MDEEPGGRQKDKIRWNASQPPIAALIGDAVAFIIGYAAGAADEYAPYGWGLFVVLPAVCGLVTGGALAWMQKRKVPVNTLGITSIYCFIFAIPIALGARLEGLVCLFMAFPLTYLVILLSAMLGSYILSMGRAEPLRMTPLALIPFLLVVEAHIPKTGSYNVVTTTIVVNATPEKIWPYLVNLDHITPTKNLLFASGVARPMSTHTNGAGLQAPRFCELSTGEMPEVISVWQPGRLLVFEMLSTPACMKEWNPFGPVDAPHLHGYFVCHQGRFELKALGPNKTEIIGTSTYDEKLGPSWYWDLWCTYIVHSVHSSVLEEIKRRAEREDIAAR